MLKKLKKYKNVLTSDWTLYIAPVVVYALIAFSMCLIPSIFPVIPGLCGFVGFLASMTALFKLKDEFEKLANE